MFSTELLLSLALCRLLGFCDLCVFLGVLVIFLKSAKINRKLKILQKHKKTSCLYSFPHGNTDIYFLFLALVLI